MKRISSLSREANRVPSTARPPPTVDGNALWLPAMLVLALAFLGGGSSVETGTTIMWAEWLALPLLLASWFVGWRNGALARARLAACAAGGVLLLPLLQLLPLPELLWQLAPARRALLDDLAAFGIASVDFRWSLTPAATERDAWLMLPPLALFFATLAMGRSGRQRLLHGVVALALLTLLLGFAQLGAPQDSFLNPFPQFKPELTGVFANANHQASMLAIGTVLSLALLLAGLTTFDGSGKARLRIATCSMIMLLFLLAMPLLNSRAGLIIALIVGAFVLLHTGPLVPSNWRGSRLSRISGLLALTVIAAGMWSAFAWVQADSGIEGSRWAMTVATARLALENLPWGSGFGSFVRMFEQGTQGALMHHGYINNAHNDYIQWLLEGGIPALLELLLVIGLLVHAAWRLLGMRHGSRNRRLGLAAFSGVLVLLLHSTVDYPLRTPALMVVAGVLAGITVASANSRSRQR